MVPDPVVVEIALTSFARLMPLSKANLTLLNDQERARAAGLKTQALRSRFIATRAYTRQFMARHTGRPPRHIDFQETRCGKKVLAGGPHFSLSHTRDWLALTVCDTHDTGVDIEPVSSGAVVRDLMRTCCSIAEQTRLSAMTDEAMRCRAFTRMWTRKEALVKAEGSGLRIALAALTMNLDAGCQDALIESTHAAIDPDDWRVLDSTLPTHLPTRLPSHLPSVGPDELIGAVAVAGRNPVRVVVRVDDGDSV